MLAFLQRIGRSLMVPIAVMPAAALLLRLGQPDLLDIPFIAAAGSAIFDNLALLFAIGIAIGMSDDHRGEAVLAAVVGFFVLIGATTVLLTGEPPLGAGYPPDDDLVTRLGNNVLIGILAGLVAVWTYNRFRQVKLPAVLGFFSGRRLVPILTSVFVLVLAVILRFVWPPLWNGLESFNNVILGWGAFGTGVFGLLNRALLPIGLHHVLNSFFWFGVGEYVTGAGEVVTGDIPRFLNGDPTAGAYQVGFFPIMMFGLVGAALAMILLAKKSERSKTAGILGGAALVSFVTGITEPLEFAFLFVAPVLYIAHALLTAASNYITNYMGLRHGFGFSAGLIDYLLNYGLAERPLELALVGGGFFVAYFLIFYGLIRFLNLKTPGREDAPELSEEDLEAVMSGVSEADDELTAQAKGFVTALGGPSNIVSVDNCATRLRLTVNDTGLVNDAQLAALGAKGVVKPSRTAVQVVVGVEAEFVADAVRDVLQSTTMPARTQAAAQPAARRVPAPRAVSTADDPAVVASINLMIRALGGADNIVEAQPAAATRVRVVVEDPALVDVEALRAAGASGVMAMGETFHILLGLQAEVYGAEMQARLIEARL
jgi:PTS system N-acetylglucosamine-specific IIC component